MSKTSFAFFDFDNTLCKGDSILPFVLWCVRTGRAPASILGKAFCGYVKQRLHPEMVSIAKMEALSFLKGKPKAEIDEIARGFFR